MLPLALNTLLQQRYRILQILGEGRFGRTYLAIDNTRGADQYYAIAEITPSTQFPATVAKAKESFRQQAELLYELQHPQLPLFWATFEEQNRLFLVQDYIAGKTYGELIDDRRNLGTQFSEFEVWQFLLKTLPVLSYIHSKGIIHRNISPDNIICRDSDLLPVPIDFGIVKEFANKLQPNPTSQVNPSFTRPGYAPPEQLKTGQVYPNSDLYSLAVSAIVLLTGKEPIALFDGDSMNWDWRRWTIITDSFANVLQRMLSLQPADRFRSAHEVLQALQNLNIPNPQPLASPAPGANRPSEMPTVAVGGKQVKTSKNGGQNALTNLNIKSFWEKPQVFIPLGVLISLLAGVGSWFGVTYILHNQKSPVSSNSPAPADFNNPTIATDSSPIPTDSTIEPVMGQAILKEGTIAPNTSVRYNITGVSGQNLDIQLVPIGTQSTDPNKIDSSQVKDAQATPAPSVTAITTTQVLMTVLSPTGTPIDAQADRVVSWRGEIPVTGEYTIELRPIAGLAGTSFPYKLSVTQVAAPVPQRSSSDPYGTTPVTTPVPRGENATPLGAENSQSDPNQNNLPSPVVPVEIPTTRPSRAIIPQTGGEENVPERRRNSTPRRNRIEEESPPSRTPARTRRQSSNEETPRPRRQRQRPENTETPTQPSPDLAPEGNSIDNNVTPQPEPALTPPTSDNQAPQPNTTDGGNSAPPTNETTPSSSPATSNLTDPN